MTSAPMTAHEAQAGVIATRPATAPDAAPASTACPYHPLREHPRQHRDGRGQQRIEEREGGNAIGFQVGAGIEAEPAHHSSAAPTIVSVRLCGAIDSLP